MKDINNGNLILMGIIGVSSSNEKANKVNEASKEAISHLKESAEAQINQIVKFEEFKKQLYGGTDLWQSHQ